MPTISAHHAQLRRYRPRPGAANGGAAHADGGRDDELEPPGTMNLYGHTAAVHSVDMTVDQRLILSGSSDGTIRVWGAEFGSCLAVYPGHMFPVWDVASCPGGHWFASGGADRVARLWVSERTAPLRLLVGHSADVDVVRWHPNCTLLATASADRTLRLWDVREGKSVRYGGSVEWAGR
jgi:transcription initiation factor TFIID subunit 5